MTQPRFLSYIGVAAILILVRFAIPAGRPAGADFRALQDLHTLMEIVATLLAFGVGAIALVHSHSRRDGVLLFVAMGFIGTGLMDGYHTWVTSTWFVTADALATSELIPWSWNASRFMLSSLMFLSWLAWKRDGALAAPSRISDRTICVVVLAFTLLTFLLFAYVPLPRAYFPDLFLSRPEELVSAALFLCALAGYLTKGKWRTDAFEHGLVLSLILGFFGQALFMSTSRELFDNTFFTAHVLKKASYFCVLAGVLVSTHKLLVVAEHSTRELQDKLVELDQANSFLDSIVENIPNMIFVKDAGELRFVRFNRAGEDLLGFARSDLIGKNDYDFFPRQEANFFTAKDREVFANREVLDIPEEPIHTRHKGTRVLHTKKVPLYSRQGAPLYLLGISEDITDKKRVEERLKETNRELERFAYVCSHDLKAPLRAIDNLSQWIAEDADGTLSSEALIHLEKLRERVRCMTRLIEDLLKYSRVGEAAHPLEEVDVRRLIEDTLALLQPSYAPRVGFDGEFPKLLTFRPPLEQIFINLIGNAIKHHREPDDLILAFESRRVGDRWEFSVIDNGPGIPEPFQAKALQMFHTLEPREGEGMGLAIVDKLVRKHGGRLILESAEGQGATFRFTWPTNHNTQGEAPS